MSDVVVPGPVARASPPRDVDERRMIADYIDWHRATLLRKCEGLTAEQLMLQAVPPSNLSLLGLVRHLADVERGWFRRGIGDETSETAPPIFYRDDDEEGDIDFGPDADAAADVATYLAEIERGRQAIEAADSLDRVIGEGDDGPITVRWVLQHMLEEYARHNGHADLIREAIDGRTGE
ncbi:MAG: DinB family protein [Acidimicrobiales bacterium]